MAGVLLNGLLGVELTEHRRHVTDETAADVDHASELLVLVAIVERGDIGLALFVEDVPEAGEVVGTPNELRRI